jgi:membrane protein required for colicin V production
MNFLDIIFLFILLVFFFLGYKRGFLLSLLQLLGIVLVIVLIRQFGTVIREGIHHQFGISDTWAIVLGYIVIFIIIMILAKIISLVLQKLIALIHLGWIDRLVGGIVNLLFCFALIVILVLILEISTLSNSLGEVKDNSKIYNSARIIADDIINNYLGEIPGRTSDEGWVRIPEPHIPL